MDDLKFTFVDDQRSVPDYSQGMNKPYKNNLAIQKWTFMYKGKMEIS